MTNINYDRYEADDMRQAVQTLKEGGIILYPTDTVWGIGCDATNPEAVQRIYQIKQRDDQKAMLVLTDNIGKIDLYVQQVPTLSWDLVTLSEKPLTIIYPQAKNLAPNLIAADGSIGIRVTNELFSKALCERLNRPIVSTSANLSGQRTPQNFSEIGKEIRQAVDYVVRYRRTDNRRPQPSSIIRLGIHNEIEIIRK